MPHTHLDKNWDKDKAGKTFSGQVEIKMRTKFIFEILEETTYESWA
jgi:hypothetical protein